MSPVSCLSPHGLTAQRRQNRRPATPPSTTGITLQWDSERNNTGKPVYAANVSQSNSPGRCPYGSGRVPVCIPHACSRPTERRLSASFLRLSALWRVADSAPPGLNLNVIVPANTTKDSRLPVAVVSRECQCNVGDRGLVDPLCDSQWIYGGAFQIGSNAAYVSMPSRRGSHGADMHPSREPGDVIVARSIEIGHPIIYVSMNYRLSGMS